MDRPKIICHILQSVDGNIDGSFFSQPETMPALQEYARIREEYACDAVISGATTAAEIYRGGFIGILPQASEHWPRTDRKAASAEKYAVVIDGTGSVRWESGNVERRGEKMHVIVVLQENATDAYISHLRRAGVSYIFAGKDGLDLPLAARKLKELFGIESIWSPSCGHRCMRVKPRWTIRCANWIPTTSICCSCISLRTTGRRAIGT